MIPIISLIKPSENYTWYKYVGSRKLTIVGKARETVLQAGSVYGVRQSANGKHIRLVTAELGLTKVITIDTGVLAKIIKLSSPTKQPRNLGSRTFASIDSEDTEMAIVTKILSAQDHTINLSDALMAAAGW